MIPKFTGAVEKGKLSLDYQESFTNYYKTLEGKKIQLVLQEYKKDRSGNQNRYCWGVVYKMISDYTGHTPEEIHAYYSDRFLGFNEVIMGKEMRIAPTTTKLKTMEFEDYLSKIKQAASEELQLFIPDPNQVAY